MKKEKRPTFDDSCVWMTSDDKDAVYDALGAALKKAKRPKPPWTDERRVEVGRLICLMKHLAAKPGREDGDA